MLFNKKASLEISIQAIVIVVLAMTLLGLGLGFIRGQFKTISETAGSVQEQIKQQILDDLRQADKKLSFPTNEVVIEKQGSKVLAVGVKNTNPSQLFFSLNIKKIATNNGARSDPIGDNDGVFIYNKGVQSLSVNDARVHPIKYTAPTTPDTLTFEVIVCACGSSAAASPPPPTCSGNSVSACAADATVYDSKTFFVTVT